MKGIFISYRQSDSTAWSSFLHSELRDVFGEAAVFLDRVALHAGSWPEQIKSALAQCCAMLVVIGPGWLSAGFSDGRRRLDDMEDTHCAEIAAGLATAGVTVIPVLVDGAAMPLWDQLPQRIQELANCQARSFSARESHRVADLRELCEDLVYAGAIPLKNEDVVAATLPDQHADATTKRLNYVARSVDEANARRALDRWAHIGISAGSRPKSTVLTSIELWWVPVWRLSGALSMAWEGRLRNAIHGANTVAQNNAQATTERSSPVSGLLGPLPMCTSIVATEELGADMPALLDERSALRTADFSEAIDTQGQEADVTILEGTARLRAKAEFRKRAIEELMRQHVFSEFDLSRADAEVDDLSIILVWCPVWRGCVHNGSDTTTVWVAGDTGVVSPANGQTGALNKSRDRLPSHDGQIPAESRTTYWVGGAALVLVATAVAMSQPWRTDRPLAKTERLAEPQSPPSSGQASLSPGAQKVSPTSSATSTQSGEIRSAIVGNAKPQDRESFDGSRAQIESAPPQRQSSARVESALPTTSTPPGIPVEKRSDTLKQRPNTPPSQAVGGSAVPEPHLSQSPTVQPVETAVTVRREAEEQAQPAVPTEVDRTPDQACIRRVLGEKDRCLRRECQAPKFQLFPSCVELRQRDEARQRTEAFPGG